jgi:dihydroorotate dehydrogenase (fumarate)
MAQFDQAGADGIVVFNRLFENDIDPDTEKHTKPFDLSQPGDSRLPRRFIGLAYGHIKPPLCANTGIFTGADVAKAVLAGAHAVQIVTTLYENGTGHTKTMLAELEAWMDAKSYTDLAAFRGKLAQKNVSDPFVYKRAQYVDLLLRSEELLASIGY